MDGVIRFAVRLVRPHWKWLVIVPAAVLVETALGLPSLNGLYAELSGTF